jgi:hypothetical protein
MEENIKYYTPGIEEFYVGFECEWQSKTRNESWNKQIVDADLISIALDAYEHSDKDEPFNEQFRVKLLDKEDIEDIGFIKSKKNTWVGWNDYYYLEHINPEYGYFLFCTLHISILDNMHKICVHRYYDNEKGIDTKEELCEYFCVYIGTIKNKSELKRLLKRLNIQ